MALKIAAILTTLFLFAGISYSYWTEDVDVFVNAGTADTELKITDSSLIYNYSSNIDLNRYKNIEYVKVFDLNSEGAKISLQIKNTGTIPIHIDAINFFDFKITDGKKNDDKDINIEVKIIESGNTVLDKDTNFGKAKGKYSYFKVKAKQTIRLEPGETATVYLEVIFKANNNDNEKNNGKGNDKDNNDKIVSFDFNMEIVYSRFNE